ncbi:hypothetical protein [uncultured Litoreibacter sp.]|uniref:hypothetical protein n=1 Tax=uncultured Litoreibacter sp. TaxID=1392394 RepID=UPI00262810AC|nr:hypothetical protein [uncultured Litoreibacter sp.]
MLWPTSVTAQEIVVAGSPVGSISDRNYARLFRELRANGISTYFPTFQFQEVPRPKSLGFETDFVAPCSPDDPAFQELRKSGVRLLIPGEFVYPDPHHIGHMPPAEDPLTQIISCAGRDAIAGITNYDEAAFHGISLDAVAAFYARVKEIDPSLPVLMVHGPIITDKRSFRSKRRISAYLEKVTTYSEHADIVGFDIYPIPAMVAKIATPQSGGAQVTPDRVVQDYMAWINQALPNKRKLVVLQGFAYTNLYEATFLKANVPEAVRDAIKPPTPDEIAMMYNQASAAGAEMVVFWGTSSLPDSSTAPWPAILELGRKHGP